MTDVNLNFWLSKNVIVIPTPPDDTTEIGPLDLLNDKPILQHTYENAGMLKRGEVIIATPSRITANYCSEAGWFWRPVNATYDNDIDRIRDVVHRFRRNLTIESIVYWPWFRPFLPPGRTRLLIKKALEDRVTSWLVDTDGVPLLGVYPLDVLKGGSGELENLIYDETIPPALTAEGLDAVSDYLTNFEG